MNATPVSPPHHNTPIGPQFGRPESGWRLRLYTVIFEADTRAGRAFDMTLIWLILASIIVVVLDSVSAIHSRMGSVFQIAEWIFTLLFTLEYVARLACVRRPARYAASFYGIVDFLAVLPTYLALFFPAAHSLLDVRVLRLLRLFRLLKLVAYVGEFGALGRALIASRRKILIFLSFVLMITLILGTVMYVVEGPEHGFTSIPISVYWAIVTMTTVGYGDLTPQTDFGRFVASVMMLIGWGILAVPTGIVSAEMTAQRITRTPTTRTCHECLTEGHEPDAGFCKHCGKELPVYSRD